MSLPRVLYIAGFGRSGSTFLDLLLGNEQGIFGAGELVSLFRHLARDNPCSCRQSLRSCPVWGGVWSAVSAELGGITYERALDISRSMDHVFPRLPREPGPYALLWRTVFRELRTLTGCEVVVDSSKTMRGAALRPRALAGPASLDVRVMHLVRDPRAVVWSTMRGWWRVHPGRWSEVWGPDSKPGLAVRGIGGWVIANLMVRSPDLVVRYEDFVRDPARELTRIAGLLETDLSGVVDALASGVELEAGHGVSGNRTRRRQRITLEADLEWESAMSAAGRLIASLGAPLAKRYGYFGREHVR